MRISLPLRKLQLEAYFVIQMSAAAGSVQLVFDADFVNRTLQLDLPPSECLIHDILYLVFYAHFAYLDESFVFLFIQDCLSDPKQHLGKVWRFTGCESMLG